MTWEALARSSKTLFRGGKSIGGSASAPAEAWPPPTRLSSARSRPMLRPQAPPWSRSPPRRPTPGRPHSTLSRKPERGGHSFSIPAQQPQGRRHPLSPRPQRLPRHRQAGAHQRGTNKATTSRLPLRLYCLPRWPGPTPPPPPGRIEARRPPLLVIAWRLVPRDSRSEKARPGRRTRGAKPW
jgi:hypothetical protein